MKLFTRIILPAAIAAAMMQGAHAEDSKSLGYLDHDRGTEHLTGDVFIERAGKLYIAQEQSELFSGDKLLAGDGTNAMIVFNNGCTEDVPPQTSTTLETEEQCDPGLVFTALTQQELIAVGSTGFVPLATPTLLGPALTGSAVAGAAALSNNTSSAAPSSP